MQDNLYFKKYGIDISCDIQSIFELSDSEKLNAIKMLLDNLNEWWGTCINCEQEEIEYNKLQEIIQKLEELQTMRKNYIEYWNEELESWERA